MAYCTKCGSLNTEGVTTCTSCGAPIAVPGATPARNTTYNSFEDNLEGGVKPVSIGGWIGIGILLGIPIINIITMIVILVSSGIQRSLKNYIISMFIFIGISIVLAVAAFLLSGGNFTEMWSNIMNIDKV